MSSAETPNQEVFQQLIAGLPLLCGHERTEDQKPWARCDQCRANEVVFSSATIRVSKNDDLHTYLSAEDAKRVRTYCHEENSTYYKTYFTIYPRGGGRPLWRSIPSTYQEALMVALYIDMYFLLGEDSRKLFQAHRLLYGSKRSNEERSWLLEKLAYQINQNYLSGRDRRPSGA